MYGNFSGESGRWQAFLPPTGSRRQNLYLLRRSHNGHGNMVREVIDGKEIINQVTYAQVTDLTLTTVPDGEFLDKPTMTALPENFAGKLGHSEITEFIQAIVNLGASIGILPEGMADGSKELAAVRAHLADTRDTNTKLIDHLVRAKK